MMSNSSPLFSGNAEFLDALYQRYLDNPEDVDPTWRSYFANLGAAELSAAPTGGTNGGGFSSDQARSALAAKQVKVLEFISANRYRGHREADLDPLHLHERPKMPELHLEHYGFTEEDLDTRFNTASMYMESEATLREIRDILKKTYCATIGTELTHITATHEKRWIQERLERVHGQFDFTAEKKRDILRWVTSARKLEDYLHRRYVGQKRFSLEGGEALIPMLDEVIQKAGENQVKEIVIGMAHRGRLNVLVNILGKHPKILFGEFEGKIDVGQGSGDVKYHLGFSSDVQSPGGPVHLVLAFNPSHLEIINPVVEGSVRARQERRGDKARNEVLPILLHGDAAFAGQAWSPKP